MKKPANAPTKGQADGPSVDILRQKITDLVGNDPQKAAIVLADWLKASEKAPDKTVASKPAAPAAPAKKKAG